MDRKATSAPPALGSSTAQRSKSGSDDKEIEATDELLDFLSGLSVEVSHAKSLDLREFAERVIGSGDNPVVFSLDPSLNGGQPLLAMGVIAVSASIKGGTVQLEVAKPLQSAFAVYWLPWDVGKTNFVSWDVLDSSGANGFMTVPLSGCMVVIAEDGILHVTADAYSRRDQQMRLTLENDARAVGRQDVPIEHTWGLTRWPRGYDKKDKNVSNRGLVFGFKDSGVWYFYFLARVNADGEYSWAYGVKAE